MVPRGDLKVGTDVDMKLEIYWIVSTSVMKYHLGDEERQTPRGRPKRNLVSGFETILIIG